MSAQRESRLERQAREHAEMRERLHAATLKAVTQLVQLRAHRREGHFVNGFFVHGSKADSVPPRGEE